MKAQKITLDQKLKTQIIPIFQLYNAFCFFHLFPWLPSCLRNVCISYGYKNQNVSAIIYFNKDFIALYFKHDPFVRSFYCNTIQRIENYKRNWEERVIEIRGILLLTSQAATKHVCNSMSKKLQSVDYFVNEIEF